MLIQFFGHLHDDLYMIHFAFYRFTTLSVQSSAIEYKNFSVFYNSIINSDELGYFFLVI